MRVLVLFAPNTRTSSKAQAISKALAIGIGEQGHTVDVLDASLDAGARLSAYDYIAIGTEATTTFGGKIPASLTHFFRTAGTLSGKRCFAFVTKGGVRKMKTLQTLMKTMEGEGMFLRRSEILKSADLARVVGKNLQIG